MALRKASQIGPYFTVKVTKESTDPALLALYNDHGVLSAAISSVSRLLKVGDVRVAASCLQFAIAARLWSVVLGTLAADHVLVDVTAARFRIDTAGRLALVLPRPTGWDAASLARSRLAQMVVETVVDTHFRPLNTAVRSVSALSDGVLRANVASALDGAMKILALHDPANTMAPIVAALRRVQAPEPTLIGSATLFRRSCCLYYRTPGGHTCVDCPRMRRTDRQPERGRCSDARPR